MHADQLSPARGVCAAVLISVAMWIGLAIIGADFVERLMVLLQLQSLLKVGIYVVCIVVLFAAIWIASAVRPTEVEGSSTPALARTPDPA